jgi:hypothetical protein
VTKEMYHCAQGTRTVGLSEAGVTCETQHLTEFSSLMDPIDFVGVSHYLGPATAS